MPYAALVRSNMVTNVVLEARLGALHQKRVTTFNVRIDHLIEWNMPIEGDVILLHRWVEWLILLCIGSYSHIVLEIRIKEVLLLYSWNVIAILEIPTNWMLIFMCRRCDHMAKIGTLFQVILILIVICLRSLLEYGPEEAGDVLLLGFHNDIAATRTELAGIGQYRWHLGNIFINASWSALRLCHEVLIHSDRI